MSIHILHTPCKEIHRHYSGPKWCFGCRKRVPHDWVTYAPIDPMSYYGPHARYECSKCKLDRTEFPS